MNAKLLKNSIVVIKELREELHSKAEDSVLKKLDQVIADLEKVLQEDPSKICAKDVLLIIGSILETIPAIVEAIKLLSTLQN